MDKVGAIILALEGLLEKFKRGDNTPIKLSYIHEDIEVNDDKEDKKTKLVVIKFRDGKK